MTPTEAKTKNAAQVAAQVAVEFAALKRGRVAAYVGGGWLTVRNAAQTGSLCAYRVRLSEARAAIARAQVELKYGGKLTSVSVKEAGRLLASVS